MCCEQHICFVNWMNLWHSAYDAHVMLLVFFIVTALSIDCLELSVSHLTCINSVQNVDCEAFVKNELVPVLHELFLCLPFTMKPRCQRLHLLRLRFLRQKVANKMKVRCGTGGFMFVICFWFLSGSLNRVLLWWQKSQSFTYLYFNMD